MAEEKDFMASQDFLGDLTKNVSKSTGSGLFEKLSANARQQALQPLVGLSNIKKAVAPLIELKDKAETAQKAGMAAYIAANPEIDESLLYDGTGDLVNNVMQQNNLRFREINQQLSFMDIRNPKYQELANELNQINTTSAQLREDNKKLLGIRNIMKDDNRVEELTAGMTKSERDMYEDILSGNKNNFVNVNGKLHWQDPNNPQEDPMAISSLDAGGPMYTNSVVMEKHIGLYNEVINAQFVDDAVLYSKINSLWKNDGVGNAGLKSFIFDNRDADDAMGFDTNDWFNSWYEANGIADDDEDAKMAEYERIRSVGVTADALVEGMPGVKKHFTKWYHNEMKSNVASQYNKKKAAETKTTQGGRVPLDPIKPFPTGDLDKSLLGELNKKMIYKDQTGSGEQFGIAKSPFAGITQYGWTQAGLDKDDAIFDFGDGEFVETKLNDAYSKYGFKFKALKNLQGGTFGDRLVVTYNGEEMATYEFDNLIGDESEAEKLQEAMHNKVNMPLKEEEVDDLPLNIK